MAIKPNNNPKNRQAYIDFQRRMLELEKKTRIRARKEIIKRNIENWVSMLPENLKNAKYDEIPVSVKTKFTKGKSQKINKLLFGALLNHLLIKE